MSYLVLARKWRPRDFSEIVGQEHVVRALSNALDSGRVHHAFLLTGTRGVGKTTLARILAKCLNCEAGVSSKPDGSCAACREIDEGRFVDLLEVDAASRTKVDDTRELLDNVQYAPSRGRFKVYLIDEVHMLSTHSFNALLKTLEEPPPHVKFLLATTDPQKLPVTVLSRCLQFNLKRLPVNLIAARLKHIVAAEGMQAEPAAIELLARAADGSLRDALSLLDQLIAFSGGKLTEGEARAMLGTVDRAHTVRLLEQIAAGDATGVMQSVAALDEYAPDYAAALDDLATLIQKVALRQAIAGYAAGETFAPETLDSLAGRMPPEDLQLYYQLAIVGRRDLDLAPEQRSGFEMVLLRMLAFRPAQASDVPARVPRTTSVGAAPDIKSSNAPAASRGLLPDDSWRTMIGALDVQGAARQLAINCTLLAREQNQVWLLLDPRGAHFRTRQTEETLAGALGRVLGGEIQLQIELAEAGTQTPARELAQAAEERLQAARVELESDSTVRALQERLGATLISDSIKPLN
ncbi:MAG TPA: DNA polymerase III subunit gamma/tau [Steroidobacteraceae bacterium]|nr:DNA polymerase III subunit gamma/tau [Steroidobacteraceae bacterium]